MTTYHPQTDGQVERFTKRIVALLCHYVAEHQTDWDHFVQPLMYANNVQVHRWTGTTQFSIVFSRRQPGPGVSDQPLSILTDI